MIKTTAKFFFLILLLCQTGILFGQYEVEFNEIKGTLSKSDEYKKDFGRYDGYQVPLYKGEAVNFVAYSEKFMPRLFFVTPAGKVFKQSNPTNDNVASIITMVPESGEWILYVVGDSLSSGSYTFQYAFASANSIQIDKDADFCTTLKFITAHAKAYFLLFENPVDSKQAFVKLNGAVDAFIDESDGSYTAKMFEGNSLNAAEKEFKDLSDKIKNCLGSNWSKSNTNWNSVEDFKEKTILFSEQVSSKGREVKLNLKDLRSSKQKFTSDYEIEIIINRKIQ